MPRSRVSPTDEVQRLSSELAQARAALARNEELLLQALHAARSDALTGLPNRRGFAPLSERTLATHEGSTRQLALLFVDLDGFKAINDRFGHDVGDELLRIVGKRLAQSIRRGDLICRHGGDEFVCLLGQLRSSARARAIALQLARAIALPCQIGSHCVAVTASIGIALYPRHGSSVGALLASADAAMYSAKALGSRVATARATCASALSSPMQAFRV